MRTSQQTNDQTVVNILSAIKTPNIPPVTVFCPINEALAQLPTDPDLLRNDLFNLIVKDNLTLEKLRNLNGLNISKTFGFMPRLSVKTVKNFYSRRPNTPTIGRRKRQIPEEYPMYSNVSDKSIYDQYFDLYGIRPTSVSDGLNISPKLPQDEVKNICFIQVFINLIKRL